MFFQAHLRILEVPYLKNIRTKSLIQTVRLGLKNFMVFFVFRNRQSSPPISNWTDTIMVLELVILDSAKVYLFGQVVNKAISP